MNPTEKNIIDLALMHLNISLKKDTSCIEADNEVRKAADLLLLLKEEK